MTSLFWTLLPPAIGFLLGVLYMNMPSLGLFSSDEDQKVPERSSTGFLEWFSPFTYYRADRTTLQSIIGKIITLYAMYLNYNCNLYEMSALRVLYMFIAFMFTPYYLIYYMFYHKLLVRPCARSFGDQALPSNQL